MNEELYERACKMIGRQALEIERHFHARVGLADELRRVADKYIAADDAQAAAEIHKTIALYGV